MRYSEIMPTPPNSARSFSTARWVRLPSPRLNMAGASNLKGKILIDTANPMDYTTERWSLTICNNRFAGRADPARIS